MNSSAANAQREREHPEIPEADPNVITRVNKQPNVVFEDQHENPSGPRLTERAISARQSAILQCYIIAGNCFCSGSICLCLWDFSKFDNLTQWEKHWFTG